MSDRETITFLPLVKAYPALSKTYGEVSCIAGVQYTPDPALSAAEPRWIRLYPVPFRDLDGNQQFAKYQPIRVAVQSHSGDTRPETRRPDRESIRIVGDPIPSSDSWLRRRRFVEPLMAGSMCEIRDAQRKSGTSLGIFRPKRVFDLEIEAVDVKAEKAEMARAWVAQGSLLRSESDDEKAQQVAALEQIPWRFKLHYECSAPGCGGNHHQSIIDWEIAQFYRRVRNGSDWQKAMRAQILGKICGADKDTALIVGNQHQHLNSFLILGLWWPPRSAEQLALG